MRLGDRKDPGGLAGAFEDLLAEVWRLLAGATGDEKDCPIAAALGAVGEAFELDRILVWELGTEEAFGVGHSWIRPELADTSGATTSEGFPFLTGQLRERRDPILFADPGDLPADAAAVKDYCTRVGIRSALVIPIEHAGAVIGAITYVTLRHAMEWTDARVSRLRILGQLFGVEAHRQATERALRKSEARFRETAELLPSMVCEMSLDGSMTYMNQLGLDTFGVSRERLAEGMQAIEDFLHPDDHARARENMARVLRGDVTGEAHEYRGVTAGGDVLQLVARSAAMFQDGVPTGLRTSVNDVTERVQLRASLAQADRLASMGVLAAGVAHEINNPLTYVMFNVRSAVDQLGEAATQLRAAGPSAKDVAAVCPALALPQLEDLLSQLDDAAEGVGRIAATVNDLKAFSQVEEHHLGPLSVNDVLSSAADLVANEMRFRARVVRDFGPVPKVMANAGKLSQLFLNLLQNAAHAIEEGDVEHNEIRMVTRTEGDELCVAISDTGTGIAGEHLPRLFDPFFTTKDVGTGSGLGLAICQSIAKGLGGAIEVESEPGRGSRFTLRLPVSSAADAPLSERPAAPQTTPRGRFLVVDDEAQICVSVRRILRDHDVVAATSGAQAQSILQQDQAFDAILCDLMMPAVTGMDLHQWLVEQAPALAERMAFMTGGAFTPRARAFLARVTNRQLDKPISPADLRRWARDLTGSRDEPRS